MPNKYDQYKAAAIQTLTPGELVVLLYEEAILSINRAAFFINNKKLSSAHKSIRKAEDIIEYLAKILDPRYPISDQLLKIYNFIYGQLVNANIKKDVDLLSKMAGLLTELKDSWGQAERSVNQKMAAGGTSV